MEVAVILFLLKYWRESLIGLLLVVAVTAWHAHDTALVERGKAQEKYRVADSALKALKPALARTDTQLVHDTVTLTVYLASRIAPAKHDTVLKHLTDTVKVKEYIAQTDTALGMCRDLMSACAVFRTQAQATIAALESKVKAIPVAMPTSCVGGNALWGVLGAGVGFLGGRAIH